MKNQNKISILVLAVLCLIGISIAQAAKWTRGPNGELITENSEETATETTTEKAASNDPAVARTRKQIQMLDDLYKTAVVLITEHYVNDPSTLSAATASKALFAAMKQKGWHDARLLGFTDVLFNPGENAPQDEFEKTAKSKLLGGEATYEEVVNIDGRDHLRMATTVPVVMEKCVMCHANFKDKKGAIGAISYTVPLIK